jgi:hypothetical protein
MKLSHPGTTCALVLCLMTSPLGGTLFAEEQVAVAAEPFRPLGLSPSATAPFESAATRDAAGDRLRRSFHEFPLNAINEEQRGYRSRRGRGRGAAAAAIMIGAAAAVAGTALLVYANRPECNVNHSAAGCGYGTKVAGGSFLAGGAIGIAVGAALWR